MNITSHVKRTSILAAVAIAGYSVCLASVPTVQSIPASVQPGGTGSQCPGPFTGYSVMTNSAGGAWITPPAGSTNCTFIDASNFSTNYASVASVMRKSDGMTWCANTSVSFPVASGDKFELLVYVVAGQPTNNPLVLNVQANWNSVQ